VQRDRTLADLRLVVTGVALVLLVGQLALMPRLLKEPRAKAAWYSATGVTLYVLGRLVTAFASRADAL